MLKLLARTVLYYIALTILSFAGAVTGAPQSLLLFAFVLALANALIRPLILLCAFPLSLVSFGIANIFANMPTILLADAICAGAATMGFWPLALFAILVMICDSLISWFIDKRSDTAEGKAQTA